MTISRRRSGPGGVGDIWNPSLGPWISASPVLLLIATLIYAATTKSGSHWSVFAVGAIAAAATLTVGIVLGFLFGLPRTLEKQDSTALLATNTNLDQISDWLTKILVGLGLVEIGKLAHGLNSLATSIASGLGGEAGAHTFATGILVYAIADGFLLGYLWTRVVLSPLLKGAAEDLESAELRQAAKFADTALSQSLAPPPPLPPPPGGEVEEKPPSTPTAST
jgi:hypothetical protein